MEKQEKNDFSSTDETKALTVVEVFKAEGAKCVRCWNYSSRVSEDKDYPDICPTCVSAIKKDGV